MCQKLLTDNRKKAWLKTKVGTRRKLPVEIWTCIWPYFLKLIKIRALSSDKPSLPLVKAA